MSETGCNSPGSFHSHLQSLVEDYQKEIIKLRRQLREEAERGIKLAEEAKKYRLEYKNYKLSHVMDQALIKELQKRIHYLENENIRRTKASSSEADKQLPNSEPYVKDRCQSSWISSNCENNENLTLPIVLPNLSISPIGAQTRSNNLKLKYRHKMNSPLRSVTKPLCMCRLSSKVDKDVDNN